MKSKKANILRTGNKSTSALNFHPAKVQEQTPISGILKRSNGRNEKCIIPNYIPQLERKALKESCIGRRSL